MDTCTLSYAFRGGFAAYRQQRDQPEFAELFQEVERISREDNLCMSLMHVKEFARWPDAAADALIEWIDRLDVVWTYNCDRVIEREDDRALQLAVGMDPAPVEVFAPNVASAFRRLTAEQAAALRGGDQLRKLIDAARELGAERELGLMREMQARFHYDRHQDPQTREWTDDQKRAAVERKIRADLQQDAREALNRLRGLDDPEFHRRCREIADLPNHFADYVLANAVQFPAFFVGREYASRFSDTFAARTPGSRKAEASTSSFYDWTHLVVGAAYCDVFACDRETARCLVGTRERIGRSAPIFYEAADARSLVSAIVSNRGP